jgi:hypothetical protein
MLFRPPMAGEISPPRLRFDKFLFQKDPREKLFDEREQKKNRK